VSTPIYDAVAMDLGWSPHDFGPCFDLDAALSVAGEQAGDLLAGQNVEGPEAEADD
jgi:hypothetical protein